MTYSINTTLLRENDDEGEELDIEVTYRVVNYSPSCPARIRYDENDHPEEPAEYELAFVKAEAQGATLLPEELLALQDWIECGPGKERAVETLENSGDFKWMRKEWY